MALAQLQHIVRGGQPKRAVWCTGRDGGTIAAGERGIKAMDQCEVIGCAERNALRGEHPEIGIAGRDHACDRPDGESIGCAEHL